MGIQSSKKKLMKMPGTPTDRFFLITDDSLGEPILEAEFLTLNYKKINYPKNNSI
jgi:hypothetical protein